MKQNKGFAPIIIALVAVIVLAVGGIAYYMGKNSSFPVAPIAIPVNQNNLPTANQIENNQSDNKDVNKNDQSSVFQPSDTKVNGVSCHNREKYFVLNKDIVDEVGENILVKYKMSPDQIIPCTYIVEKNDFELPNSDTYFMSIYNNSLILDAGTSASRRDVIVYNLDTKKQVFRDSDDGGFKMADNMITYWGFPTTTPPALNCPKDKILVEHLSFNLNDYTKKSLEAFHCEYTE